ncbi:MAG: exodeoxyribonuclease VII large subunit [Ruminococcaceae bacterium]|nr:exodeoxyribonuclease VII large subunit [Oscillospiraceae bacterium]
MDGQAVLTVSQLTQHVKGVLEMDPILCDIYVSGEISNCKIHSSGHIYLTLKDNDAVLRAVMFRGEAHKLPFRPEDGMKVIAHGRVSVFPGAGQHQLYIDALQPDGIGALYMAYEQLKERLGKEGLFDPAHKKPLPAYPRRIALVTSPTGAAVRDMLRILRARYPLCRIRIYPVRVQGPEAPAEICEGIRFVNHYRLADLIITGRGGGSLEDLWAFNDEEVARTIYDSDIPVISAVGHEPDFTIADFVADMRAATPSNAAELAVPDQTELLAALSTDKTRLVRSMNNQLTQHSAKLKTLAASRVLQNPENTLQDRRMALAYTTDRLAAAMNRRITRDREQYLALTASLEAMNPMKVLSRGYAMAQAQDGSILTDSEQICDGEHLTLSLYHGRLHCQVLEHENTPEETSHE